MTEVYFPLSPENQMVLDELDRAEGGAVIPGYDEKSSLPPPTAAPQANAAGRTFPCKFDCGVEPFTNPGQLGAHYKANHPEHKPSNANAERITCTCGREVARASWRYHMTNMHPDVPRADWESYQARVSMPGEVVEKSETGLQQCPECPKQVKDLGKHLNRVHHMSRKGTALAQVPPKDDDKPVTTDDIVVGLVELRWPHSMPTRKVREMFDWRDHTERFLNG